MTLWENGEIVQMITAVSPYKICAGIIWDREGELASVNPHESW